MLRNAARSKANSTAPAFLNEVLSLNAQELSVSGRACALLDFLNEVLSLNAQEYSKQMKPLQ